jgi:hypothetical protein
MKGLLMFLMVFLTFCGFSSTVSKVTIQKGTVFKKGAAYLNTTTAVYDCDVTIITSGVYSDTGYFSEKQTSPAFLKTKSANFNKVDGRFYCRDTLSC